MIQEFEHTGPLQSRLISLKTDGGTEFKKQLPIFLSEKGINHHITAPYCTSLNGLAERINQTLLETTRSLMLDACLPNTFWPFAAQYAQLLCNGTPHRSIDFATPYEKVFQEKLRYDRYCYTFGSY